MKPVYPPLAGPVPPTVKRLCEAIHTHAARRRNECCDVKLPPNSFAFECDRNLAGAVSLNAVTLDEPALARCEEAIKRQYETCDWIVPGGFGGLNPPSECSGVVKGRLDAGTKCRSSLECKDALRCHGVGPTTFGVCGAARPGGPCGGSADALATYTRDDDYDTTHPECSGACNSRRCVPLVKAGGECKAHGECGATAHCESGKCSPGVLGKVGEKCVAGRCAAGLKCLEGQCASPKKDGEACSNNLECRGTCVGAEGSRTCAKDCSPLKWVLPSGSSSGATLRDVMKGNAKLPKK